MEASLQKQHLSPPKSLNLQKGTELRIVKRWFSNGLPGILLALLIFGGWGIYFGLRGGGICVGFMALLFLLNLLYYAFIYGAANTTKIIVTTPTIFVKNTTSVWKNKKFDTSNLDQIYCKKSVNYSSRHFWGGLYRYDIRAITKNGQDVEIVAGLHNALEALFIEQEIEEYLGIKDIPVAGGFKGSGDSP